MLPMLVFIKDNATKGIWNRKMTLTTDKTRISLYLDEELKVWIAKEAKQKNRSMSNYIETVLEQIRQGKIKVDI